MKIKKILVFIILIFALFLVYFFGNKKDVELDTAGDFEEIINSANAVVPDRIEKIEIVEDSTYGDLMKKAGVDYAEAVEIYDSAKPLYDLVKIRLGRFLELVYDKDTDEFKELIYQIDSEEELHVKKNININSDTSSTTEEKLNNWTAERILIPYEVKIKTSEGIVESSMYQAALDNNIDERAIIELADTFQWSIDFAMDPRKGDTFKFIYEERYLAGVYVMPGKILAGKYVNAGEEYFVYYFEEMPENIGYFDQDGNSVQKMFLKSPVAFKYISSNFTTGKRCLSSLKLCTNHRAIDYAANCGTPIRAVGNGTVTSAGWSSQGYGYLIKLHHNATYSTNYAHLSKFAVKKGQKVEQGQTIGYVGTTGLSTGCHLHYEMIKHGTKINAQNEILPPGKPIKDENKERYFLEIKKWQEILK